MTRDALQLTPAVLTALARGDLENALVAAAPGGIECQEAEGQRALCQSSRLPKSYGTYEQPKGIGKAVLLEAGVKFGKDVDDLFQEVILPKGWKLQPTEHSMWSHLLDENGRIRAKIFYKAAFYDRSADLHVATRFSYRISGDDPAYVGEVLDGGKVIWSSPPQADSEDYRALRHVDWHGITAEERTRRDKIMKDGRGYDRAHALAEARLNEHYPDWRQVQAYW